MLTPTQRSRYPAECVGSGRDFASIQLGAGACPSSQPRIPLRRHWLLVDSERLPIGISHGQNPIRLPLRISRRLKAAYPGDEETQVSHETIYQSWLIQGKGAERQELWCCPRALGSQEESGVKLANCSSWSPR